MIARNIGTAFLFGGLLPAVYLLMDVITAESHGFHVDPEDITMIVILLFIASVGGFVLNIFTSDQKDFGKLCLALKKYGFNEWEVVKITTIVERFQPNAFSFTVGGKSILVSEVDLDSEFTAINRHRFNCYWNRQGKVILVNDSLRDCSYAFFKPNTSP